MSKSVQSPTLTVALETIWSGDGVADDVESDALEFKKQQDSAMDTMNDLADAAACFANGRGGTVIVGVRDRVKGPDAFPGTTLEPSRVRRKIFEVTEPSLDVSVEETNYNGVRLLVIDVREGLDVYVSRKRVPTLRFQDQCLPMTGAQISRLHDERRGNDWSSEPSTYSLADIAPRTLAVLSDLARTARSDTIQALSRSSSDDLIRALGLVGDGDVLNNAGALLLIGPDNEREVVNYQYRDTQGGEVRTGRRWTGPLLAAYLELVQAIEARTNTVPVNLTNGQQLLIEDYPQAAVREAIANAFMHGDHREHRPIYVEHSSDQLIVRSPGPLVTGVTPDNVLTHPPKPRFPILAEAMRSLGLAEKWGQGVDRMYREMIKNGRDVPLLTVTDGAEPETVVQLQGGSANTRVARFIASLPEQEQGDTDALITVFALLRKRTVSASSLAPQVQRDVNSTERVLRRLSEGDEATIEPTARTVRRAHPEYRLRSSAIASLGSALSYQVRSRSDSDRKVIAHIREYGHINNGTIQRLFDVDVYEGRNILRDLVGREILVRISEQRRGIAVKYGKGPKFPEKRGTRSD